MEDGSEFSAVPIRDDQLVAWPRVAAVSAMVGFSILTFMTGLEVFKGLPPATALWALLWGSLIATIIGAVIGYIGASDRMSSYLLVRIAFGDKGAAIVNIALAISLLGWFGVNINLFMGATGRLLEEIWGLNIPKEVLAIIASICMTFTTLVGFKAINLLSSLLVPILAIVTVLFARAAFSEYSMTEFADMEKSALAVGDNAMSIGNGISWVVGAVIIGAIILPDITRFVRVKSGAVYTSVLTYMIVGVLVMASAGLAGASAGIFDNFFGEDYISRSDTILDLMLGVNLGFGAFMIVIAGCWALNSLNLYSTVLSTKATFPKLNTKWLTIGLGALGVVVALLDILQHFETFLWYLTAIFVPVAGVMIVDRLFIRPTDYKLENLTDNNVLNILAFASWVVAAAYAILAESGRVSPFTKVGVLDALLISIVLYFGLSKIFGRKIYS